jgi:hypothetical protein
MSTIPSSDVLMSCSGCKATIYPEHLERHVAGYLSGQLYCSYCLAEKKAGTAAPPVTDELASFPLEDVAPAPASAAGPAPAPEPAEPATPPVVPAARRAPRPDAVGATRMRIFHSKLSDGAVGHLDHQINDWLDQNPDVEIKFANTTVGVWEGKHPEPNLILALFY